jgi:hypothetical protein
MNNILEQIQQLQFADKPAAEALLREFVRATFPHLSIEQVELRPLAVSLNSFNGFLYLKDGQRLFFKTHTEPGGILSEYYNAEQLADVGYPILRPMMKSSEAGKQFLIYEFVDAPSVFDAAWSIEQGDTSASSALEAAQHTLDDDLMRLYARTLAWQTAEEAAHAPVHQLFFHRLTGGRLAGFYRAEGLSLQLANGTFDLSKLMNAKWEINGQVYDMSLNDMIDGAIHLLQPAQAGPSVIGHGDAHNGNVFFHRAPSHTERAAHLSYFDPAFAGRHHPLLDLAKPLFHNVFAMWMYHGHQIATGMSLTARYEDQRVVIHHNYRLHPVRLMFFNSKLERVLIPTVRELQGRGWLRPDWRAFLKAALLCCPLLTKNLMDPKSYPTSVALLGLSMVVEMGGESTLTRSKIDSALDRAAAALAS